ncbi:uncharacterized protein [Procambarus clarkii]|uniref:uncharacterized protein isoform X2 n=1 Tax=Procambarus clarkii TaxID=6728 RepID=UPI001E674482|nr:uncharacterized protein LOC123768704 isoform X2 [Procambarus clarkii]
MPRARLKNSINRWRVKHGMARRKKLREAMANMLNGWRAVCDAWMQKQVVESPGIDTPVCNLYTAYIQDNPDNYVDIGQFGKVLSSRYPHRKHRRGKQGSQIYVYQNIALKDRLAFSSPCKAMAPFLEFPDPPKAGLCQSFSNGPTNSFFPVYCNKQDHILVPPMTIGNQNVRAISLPIPESASASALTVKEPETTTTQLVEFSPISHKRKSEKDSGQMSDVQKKTKLEDEGKTLSKTDLKDDSKLLLKEEMKEEIEVEENLVVFSHFLTRSPSPQLIQLSEKQDGSDVISKQDSEVSPNKCSPSKRVRQISRINQKMALARQWVDANLVDKKGVMTTASAIAEAYARDHPNDPLPQTSLTVVIRGKFPTRRKRFVEDNIHGYYYRNLELVGHNLPSHALPETSTPQKMPSTFSETSTLKQFPLNIQVNTGDNPSENTSTNTTENEIRLCEMEKLEETNQDVQGIITDGEHIIMPKNRVKAICTDAEGESFSNLAEKEENVNTDKISNENSNATKVKNSKDMPMIVKDNDLGLPVAVFNPPSESVFDYQGVPCVMIPVNDISSITSNVENAKLLSTNPNTVVSPLTKLFSQKVITDSDSTKIFSSILPRQNPAQTQQTSFVKCSDLENSTLNKGYVSQQAFQSKIHIKSVCSINDMAQSESVDTDDRPDSLKYLEKYKNPKSLPSRIEIKNPSSPANFNEKENLEGYARSMDEIIPNIKIEPNEKSDETSEIGSAEAIPPSPKQHLPDMGVLDYFRSEMAEDYKCSVVDMNRTSRQQVLTEVCISSGDELEIIQKENEALKHAPKLTNVETNYNISDDKEVTMCEVKIDADEHHLDSAVRSIKNVETLKKTHTSKVSVDNSKENIQTETEAEPVRPNQKRSKIGNTTIPPMKKIKSWDEDIRSFIANSSDTSIFESRVLKPKQKTKKMNSRRKKLKDSLVRSRSGHLKSTTKSQVGKSESVLRNDEEEESLSDGALGNISECLPIADKQMAIKVKKAVLNVAFDLISETEGSLTEFQRAKKLEAAIFKDNPAVQYNNQAVRTHIKTKNLDTYCCTSSHRLEDIKVCSLEHITSLLLHHQACPGLGCQKCHTLRAAYVHITLFRHRCPVWQSFIKIVSRHSRICWRVSCSIIFCQFMKHELHLSGMSVLQNHLLEQRMILEAEFSECDKSGPHSADLHCSHHEATRVPVPGLVEVRNQQQNLAVEARGLKLMSNLLSTNNSKTEDIVTPILKTFKIATSIYYHSVKKKK